MPHDKKYYLLPHFTGVNAGGKGCMKNDMCVDLEGLPSLNQKFKENIPEIIWGCLLLPVWNAVVNAG